MKDIVLFPTKPEHPMNFRTLAMVGLVSVGMVYGEPIDFARTTKFKSTEQFVESAKNFHPIERPSEFSYLFSAPEEGVEGYGKTVFANQIHGVTELFLSSNQCAYFIDSYPQTEATGSCVAGLFVLSRGQDGYWKIRIAERFFATGVCGRIECKVLKRPNKDNQTQSLVFQIKEIDAGRRMVLDERVYTLAYTGQLRLKPVSD